MRKMLLEDTEEQLHLLPAVPASWGQDGIDLTTSASPLGCLHPTETQKIKASHFQKPSCVHLNRAEIPVSSRIVKYSCRNTEGEFPRCAFCISGDFFPKEKELSVRHSDFQRAEGE